MEGGGGLWVSGLVEEVVGGRTYIFVGFVHLVNFDQYQVGSDGFYGRYMAV